LFNHGEAQPTSGAIDDGFPAAADKFQRTISSLFLYFRPRRDDLCGQFVKFRNIVHAQIIVAIYFDYLPLGSSNGDRGSEGQGSEGKRENRPTLHWEGHVCAIVSKTGLISIRCLVISASALVQREGPKVMVEAGIAVNEPSPSPLSLAKGEATHARCLTVYPQVPPSSDS